MQYPKHLAIIPDGNRTRAKERGLDSLQGHLAGQQNSIDLMHYVFEQTPIEVLTLWGLSTENLSNRSEAELDYLSRIYEVAIDETKQFLKKLRITFRRVGNKLGLPQRLIDVLLQTQEECTFDSSKTLVLGINYGGKDELLRGIRSLSAEELATVTPELLSKKMDFHDLPVVDFVIRTKGELAQRLSGFMLWRIEYAELFFSPLLFPSFTPVALQEALERYNRVAEHRNFGK